MRELKFAQGLKSPFVDLMLRCLHKDPKKRPTREDAKDYLKEELRELDKNPSPKKKQVRSGTRQIILNLMVAKIILKFKRFQREESKGRVFMLNSPRYALGVRDSSH